MSPFEVFLDAKVEVCNCPEWELPYPQPIHLAHDFLVRAGLHLGIRLVDGYAAWKSVTEKLILGVEDPQSPELQREEELFL